MSEKPIIQDILKEQGQAHATRIHLYKKLEEKLGRSVISYFTSFNFPEMIEDADADMLSDLLQCMDLSNGIALIINSPGGIGLAAERIVNVLRSYSKTGEYWAIVPNKAKSAATMITFGASKILMSKISELGSVDPQIAIKEGNSFKRFCVYNIVESYKKLFEEATKTEGHLEPYLQQLTNYDERDIAEYQAMIDLSVDISVRTLSMGMNSDKTPEEIKENIKIFLTPEYTKTHGRPIYMKEAIEAGLNIEKLDVHSDIWKLINELYIRNNNYVSIHVSKCFENKEHSFVVGRDKI